MDELDILKKDWNNSKESFKSYSDSDIAPMLHKKSSSIVKTLFYISIAELLFWVVINWIPYISSETARERILLSYENPVFIGLTIFGFVVIFVFIYLLYTSYKSISTTDNARKLMESILKTRKVIKYYVLYNLISIFILVPLSFYFEFEQNIEFHDQIAAYDSSQMAITAIVLVVFCVILFGLFWLFYRLIYGILLKRLNGNYNELKKLEV